MENSPRAAQCSSLRFSANLTLSNHLWITLLNILLCILGGQVVQAQPRAKNVLFVFSIVKYSDEMLNVIQPYMRAHCPGPINFHYAYLEDIQSEENPSWESQAEILRRRYAGVKMDVVIANVAPSLRFAVKYREKIFPGVPIVFVSVNKRELEGQWIGPGVTGVTNPLGFKETIDLALRLHPDTKTIAVIAGTTNWDSYWLQVLHSELDRYQDKVKEIDLVGTPNRQMLERISLLSPHTLVMFQMAPQFSDQPDFGTWDLLSEVAQRFPTYSVWPRFCVNGCVGGVFKDPVQEWKMTGDLAIRVLSGERPDDIPIVHNSDLRAIVDWRALQRWHIPESALPPGSIVRFREPTLWERYRGYILAAIGLLFAQALLIVALLWQRVRKRKAEAVLRESEKRFRVMADTTPAQIWMCDERGDITYLNERRVAFTGAEPDAGYGNSWSAYIHTDDLPDVTNSFSHALKNHQPFSKEYRLRRSDGIYRWVFDIASPRVNGDGSFAGFIGSTIDVTDQKMAQQALERMGGQLIEAQEKERTRIARELHDDICQRLVILSFELKRANDARDGSPASADLEDISKHCTEIASDVQSLSHQLHSSQLDCLGLVAAISGLRNEFAKNHDVGVEFTYKDVPNNLPRNISLCIFRVTQEALHNAVKYSGASEFKVDLSLVEDKLQLVVKDEGAGFDVQEARQKGGLGLISMYERINLVRGKLNIESATGLGTRITAIVPIVFEDAPAMDKATMKDSRGFDEATASIFSPDEELREDRY